MCNRFIKFIPSEEAFWLLQQKPNAFRLLTHIANTARRYTGNPDGLSIGECHLQHWEFYNLTQREYRTSKEILVKRKHIEIVETNRSRKKSTTGSTTGSTLVRLISSVIYDINLESTDDRNDDRATTDRRLTDDKQDNIKKSSFNKEDKKEIARSAARPHSKDLLSFNFETWKFEGISEEDQIQWKEIYSHINLQLEVVKATQWLKANPTKSDKKLWRKFLTGWFNRANQTIENKKAFKVASGTFSDRRTKDISGNPVESPHTGKF